MVINSLIYRYIKAILGFFIILILNLSYIPQVSSLESSEANLINNLTNKIARSYSSKFCNAIGIGFSEASAMKLTISENKESKFNPSLWLELTFSGKKNINKISQEDLTNMIAEDVVIECGYALNLSGERGVNKFKESFNKFYLDSVNS